MSDVLKHSDAALVKLNKQQKPLQLTNLGASENRVKAITQHLIDEAAIVSLQTIMASVTQVIYNEDDVKGDLNNSHIGCIKVSPPKIGFTIANIWIKPLDAQVRSYPIVGEMVNIINYGGSTYYFQPLNITNSVSHNIFAGSEEDGSAGSNNPNLDVIPDLLNHFTYNKNPRPVKQYPGDWALNGRNDQSIRLGTDFKTTGDESLSSYNAVIKMRISDESKASVAPAGTTRPEFIDTDKASFYMTRDEELSYTVVPNVPGTTDKSTISAAAIILDSNRLIFNTKESNESGQINIFAGNTVNIVSKKNTNIIGEVIKLGDTNIDNLQSAVLGESLVNFLSQLIQRLDNLAKDLGSVTGIGNVGGIVPIPGAMAAGNKLGGWTSSTTKTIIANQILSKNIKVSKKVRPNL